MNKVFGLFGTVVLVVLLSSCDQISDLTSGGGSESEAGSAVASATAGERESSPAAETPSPAQPQAQETESREKGEPVVTLDPDNAQTEGAAQYQCKDPYGCWWLVHCGHAICSGAWNWQFPSEGTYRLTWRGVQQKCAGAPPFQIRINGNAVTSGEIPQYGSCAVCTPDNTPNIFVDQNLGTFDIDKGDKVTLWVETAFACGIDGPGAYGAFDDIVAELVD